MSRYFSPPPDVFDLPAFMYRQYPQQIYGSLMKWADNEFRQAMTFAVQNNRMRQAKILYDEWSGMRVLSQTDGFRYVCAQIAQDETAWKKLDRKTRKFFTAAYEMYELLRKL